MTVLTPGADRFHRIVRRVEAATLAVPQATGAVFEEHPDYVGRFAASVREGAARLHQRAVEAPLRLLP